MQPEPGTPGLSEAQDSERQAILELGRMFIQAVRDYGTKHKTNVQTKTVLGAIDYVKKTMTFNVNAVMDDFLTLLRFGRESGKQIHEPYANDGITPPPIVPAPGDDGDAM